MANSFPEVSSDGVQHGQGVVISLDLARQRLVTRSTPVRPAAPLFRKPPTGLRALERAFVNGAIYLFALLVGLAPTA